MIQSPAILVYPLAFPNEPLIVGGADFPSCYDKLKRLNIPYHKSSAIEGFLTDRHAFLDRYDALYEAARCGQIQLDKAERRALHVSDIWDDSR